MKKITLMMTLAFLVTFWNTNAQVCTGFTSTTTDTTTFIDDVSTFGGITDISNLSTGLSAGRYQDYFPTSSVTTYADGVFDFSVGIQGGTVGCAIWVDWNGDFTFDTATELVYNTTSYGNGPFTGSVTVPNATANGDYYMRIMIDWNDSNPDDNPCSFQLASGRGEVEDYKVTVGDAPTDVLDYYNLQWPPSGEIAIGESFSVYAQAYEAGLTDVTNGQAPGIAAWIGFSSSDTNPNGSGWTWIPADFNGEIPPSNNNDEYVVDLGANIPATGTFYYASRWSLNGAPFTYGGIKADGSGGGIWGADNNVSGVLTVNGPANDECSGAIALTVNADLSCGVVTSGTTSGATASPQPDDATGTPNNDVWYSFVATGTSHRIVISNVVNQGGGTSTSTDMAMSVFDDLAGCNMVAANEVGESDPNTLNLTGLVPTNTYYVRVYGWSSSIQNNNFDICVGTPPPPPANDDCGNAEVIAIGNTCTNITTSTASATQGDNELPSCDTVGNFGIWYSFTAPANGNLEFTSGTGNPGIVIYSGADCASLTAVTGSCLNNTSGSITGLTPGQDYYAMVWTDTAQATVEFCLYSLPCAPAEATVSVGTTDCTNNTYTVDVNITNLGSSTIVNVTNDAGLADQQVNSTGVISLGPIPVGTPITITLANDSDSACDLVLPTLNYICPPANDDCPDATTLTPGGTYSENPLDGSVLGATVNGEVAGCGSNGPGVWYSIVVPADGNIIIETGPDAATSNPGFDSVIEVFSGTCGALTSIGCNDDGGPGVYSLLNLTGLTPASTIFVRVWEYGGDDTEPFSISAYNATLSVGELYYDSFTYFPNPVKNVLTLKAQSNIQNVSIFNMLGQEVLRTAPNSVNSDVDMSSLQTGSYFVRVLINDKTETIRIIKQ